MLGKPKRLHVIMPLLFDCWADAVVRLLLLKSSFVCSKSTLEHKITLKMIFIGLVLTHYYDPNSTRHEPKIKIFQFLKMQTEATLKS